MSLSGCEVWFGTVLFLEGVNSRSFLFMNS